jgi:hypothetical protein
MKTLLELSFQSINVNDIGKLPVYLQNQWYRWKHQQKFKCVISKLHRPSEPVIYIRKFLELPHEVWCVRPRFRDVVPIILEGRNKRMKILFTYTKYVYWSIPHN